MGVAHHRQCEPGGYDAVSDPAVPGRRHQHEGQEGAQHEHTSKETTQEKGHHKVQAPHRHRHT